jgi:hypothetical protein
MQKQITEMVYILRLQNFLPEASNDNFADNRDK